MHQWRDRDFRYILYGSSRLDIAFCINGETAILSKHCKEALGSPLPHGSTARPRPTFGIYFIEALCLPLLQAPTARLQFSVYTTKKLCARRCCMYQRRDCDFRFILKRSSRLSVAACNNGETTIFGIYYQEALCSPLLRVSTAILRYSVYIMKMLSARPCCRQQWRERDFRYII